MKKDDRYFPSADRKTEKRPYRTGDRFPSDRNVKKNDSRRFDRPRHAPLPGKDEHVGEFSDANRVVGRNAVRELLASGRDVEKIFVQKGDREGSILKLIGEAAERKIPLIETDRTKLDEMAPGMAHQGIIAVASEHDYATVDDILAYAEERGEPPLVVLCDGVEDPHNLGAILRSAECLGAHGVILPKRRSVGLTSVVAKTSAGAIEHIRVAKVPNLSQTIMNLKERGLWFYAADMGGDTY